MHLLISVYLTTESELRRAKHSYIFARLPTTALERNLSLLIGCVTFTKRWIWCFKQKGFGTLSSAHNFYSSSVVQYFLPHRVSSFFPRTGTSNILFPNCHSTVTLFLIFPRIAVPECKGKFVSVHGMILYEGIEYYLYTFLIRTRWK